MTQYRTMGVFLLVAAVFSGSATAQVYFHDDFDDPAASADKWVELYGDWEFADGEYHQTAGVVNTMSVVADDMWDEGWVDYTFEVRGKKTGGAEGFLIMFRCRGMMQARGVVLNDHPEGMAAEEPSLQYWWNLGGWGNTRSQVESWGGLAGANSLDTIAMDEWYEIKIVHRADGYTLYLNDDEIAQMNDAAQDGIGRIGLAAWSTQVAYDDVIVYGPAGDSLAVDPYGKMATTWGRIRANR